jgi:penicillin amidase
MRRVLIYALVAIVLILIGSAGIGWWLVHRSLPQVDGTVQINGLKDEVVIRRDTLGVPHIKAVTMQDAALAQGYVMAQDRLWQMDILRRAASGRVSEVVGAQGLASDRNFRTLGLKQAAERDVSLLDAQERELLESYSSGVNRYIEDHKDRLPIEFTMLRYSPEPWRPADTLLIVGYMYQTLTSTWRGEIARYDAFLRLGKQRAEFLFKSDSPYQHPIVGNEQPTPAKPIYAKSLSSMTGTRGFNSEAVMISPDEGNPAARDESARESLDPAPGFLGEIDEEIRATLGSNNWVVDGSHTASGKPLLANDTHLQLAVPCIWYLIHLHVGEWNAEGFTIPGAPGIVIGHNNSIAWGFTNNGADVQDLYAEKFNPSNASEYLADGKWVAAQVRRETIQVKGQSAETLDVIVTRHGPVMTRRAQTGYALRWTATEPGGLAHSYFKIQFSHNWQEFRENLRDAAGPGQNVVYADTSGHIGFIVPARIPIRNCAKWPPIGSPIPDSLPCGATPLPGENGEYEWTGYIPFDELPQVLDPSGGIIATANSVVAGPGYRHFLSASLAPPWRTDRIFKLLGQSKKFTPDDFAEIQTDVVQEFYAAFAAALVKAAETAKPHDDRTASLIKLLSKWDGRLTVESIEATFVEQASAAFGHSLLRPYLGDTASSGGEIFLERVLRERPTFFLPTDFRNYDEGLVTSADRAVDELSSAMNDSAISAWRWGIRNKLVMAHPLGQSGILEMILSLGRIEHSGGPGAIKALGRTEGPSMRLVADLSGWDHSYMEVTTGESGQLGSEHYSDQFHAWLEGKPLASHFSEEAVQRATVHTLRLGPIRH